MKLKLVGRSSVLIGLPVDKMVENGVIFEVDDKIGASLLVQGIFEEVKTDVKTSTKQSD